MKKIIFTLFAALLLMVSPNLTYAEESKHYIGFGLGQSDIDVDFPAGALDTDTSDIAFKLFGGIELNPNFALEAGYAQFGEATARFVSSNEKDTVKSSSIFATAVGKILFLDNKAALFAKLGLSYWQLDFEADFNTPPYGDTDSGSSLDFVYGLGFEYKTSDIITIRFELEQYNNIGDGVDAPCAGCGSYTFNSADVNLIGLALLYHF